MTTIINSTKTHVGTTGGFGASRGGTSGGGMYGDVSSNRRRSPVSTDSRVTLFPTLSKIPLQKILPHGAKNWPNRSQYLRPRLIPDLNRC